MIPSRVVDLGLKALGRFGGATMFEIIEKRKLGISFVRAIGYHSVSNSGLPGFRRQLAWLAMGYTCMDETDFSLYLEGKIRLSKPGLIISFDDGLADNYRNAVPALEGAGLKGWFFVPSGLVGLSDSDARVFCAAGALGLPLSADGRLVMNWKELRELKARGHVIGCHTRSHMRLRSGIGTERLGVEIRGSRKYLESGLDAEVRSFAWVGGESDTYSPEAFMEISDAGFTNAFTTLSAPFLPGDDPLVIHRTILDPDLDFGVFRMKMLGLSDIAHRKVRLRAFQTIDN